MLPFSLFPSSFFFRWWDDPSESFSEDMRLPRYRLHVKTGRVEKCRAERPYSMALILCKRSHNQRAALSPEVLTASRLRLSDPTPATRPFFSCPIRSRHAFTLSYDALHARLFLLGLSLNLVGIRTTCS